MLDALQNMLARVQPPQWLVQELQNRVVLSLNHVLKQEPEAMERLKRQSGKSALLSLAPWSLHAQATPAGLLDLVTDPARQAHLRVTVKDNPLSAAFKGVKGEKPELHIEGDVALAGEINWLMDHVRWDYEEDLSGLIGDAPAHMLGQGLRTVAAGLRQFAGGLRGSQG